MIRAGIPRRAALGWSGRTCTGITRSSWHRWVSSSIRRPNTRSSTIRSFGNAAKDEDAIAAAWRDLQRLAGKPTWATENPRPLSVKNSAGNEIGIRAVLESKSIEGLVIYLAFPGCVKEDGSLTERGREIEQAIARP